MDGSGRSGRSGALIFLGIGSGDFAADHHRNDLFRCPAGHLECLDVFAIAEDRTDIGESRDLGHSMRDIKYGHALVAEPANNPIEMFHISGGERGGGFIHDDKARVTNQRFRDLHHLLAREWQIFCAFIRMNIAAADPV